MLSSEDEQDDNGIFDHLKSIKPFTVDQLYLLHPDVSRPPTSSLYNADQESKGGDLRDKELYQNLIEYEQLRLHLSRLREDVKKLHRKAFDHSDKAWTFKEQTSRRIAVCQQGKVAETTFRYKQAFISQKQLDLFEIGFSNLSESISKDYIYYSFESQMKRSKITTQLSIPDSDAGKLQLKSAISTLVSFIRYLGDSKTDFVVQCRNWLHALAKRFLEEGTTDNYRFVISQLARGPVGTADWSADLIECRPFEQVNEFESVPQYITHCSALLSELFFSLKSRVKKIETPSDPQAEANTNLSQNQTSSDQNWSLIDPRFSCSEELNVSSMSNNVLSEADVIKLCLKIPVAQIFRAYVKKCLESNEFRPENDKNYEFIMLKLLTIGTIIIKTYQIGLETYDSIQFGNLIEYLSSQIRRTVVILSDQWTEFKCRLRGVDDALLMRLQVEYDNFILRSILIILELRQSGIWRHLSQVENENSAGHDISQSWSTDSLRPALIKLLQVTGLSTPADSSENQVVRSSFNKPSRTSNRSPSSGSLTCEFSVEWFREVSDPMLWHILWQFYHNAFVSSCDYHSDNYWLEKFQEKSVIYLFVNKIRDSPSGECSYLLNSITSMLLSRTRQDSVLVDFIATEIFNLSFKYEALRDKVTRKGINSLVRCAEKFPKLISVYINLMVDGELNKDVVDLIRDCSLSGWLFSDHELGLLSSWLVEFPIASSQNKISRLIISKALLNSPETRTSQQSESLSRASRSMSEHIAKRTSCFVDLRLRRRLALLLYETSKRHYPENNEFGPQSLGASVEVAFGSLYCERNALTQNNLLELAIDTNYQQFYVWCWRLLFTLKLHILNQPETDWNDIQSRSGTSRSIKNTVLLNDVFHPAPSIQDSECLSLSDGVRNNNAMASFIYLLMTDVTWQVETLDTCLRLLNVLASSGHITPSLMCMKSLTICHLNDLVETLARDRQTLEYFTSIITSNFDATRLASLIVSQLDHLKQFRQLQLSNFYISMFLEVGTVVSRQISSSWFSGNEISLEKIASLLDYIVRFNFTTQRLEIVRKFYDCSHSIQNNVPTTGWFGSFFASNSLSANNTRREFLTNLHALSQKFKKYTWLRWVTTECDTLRLEKIWEDIVVFLSSHEEVTLDSAIKKVCPQVNASILKSTLPIFSWIKQIFDIMESDLNHPLCPLIWYNFFLNYFANSLNGVSVGFKLVPQETLVKLMTRLDSLFNYHLYKHRNWASTSAMQQNSLAQLYRAYKLWLQDPSLRDAYVDIDRLKEDYLVPLLKAVMESSTEGTCLQYIDMQGIEIQNRNLMQVWTTASCLTRNQLSREMIFVDSKIDESMEILTSIDDEASDAVSLIVKPHKEIQETPTGKSFAPLDNELNKLSREEDTYRTTEELMNLVKKNFHFVFDESTLFGLNMIELDKTKSEIVELVQQLHTNKRREFVRVVPCIEGQECLGPARIKIEAEEASMDERKSQCIQDRRRQCQELIGELLLMPKQRTVEATVIIEENVRRLIGDPSRAINVIETLLQWISEPDIYKQLNGAYYAANHLLKTVLEILSNTDQVDTYNSALISVCLNHPESVQIFSPHLSPSSCSHQCFLDLYKAISLKQDQLGPMAMFVLLSKFDVASWLQNLKSKEMYHELIVTTCLALKGLGKQPDESCELSFDLLKRHLQIELALPDRRKPAELSLVVSQFLTFMDEQSLAPSLWNDFMSIIGLDRNILHNRDQRTRNNLNRPLSSGQRRGTINDSIAEILPTKEHDELVIANIIEDLARLADSQIIFDYHSLDSLIKLVSQFFKQKYDQTDVTLLELYQDYLDQFSVVLIGLTFMWLKSTCENYPDNHELIWNQFIELWTVWVFLNKNCQNVGKASYSLMAHYFVAAIQFMIHKIPDSNQSILRSTLADLTHYVVNTKEVVYLELTILQRCLKNLPWSGFVATPRDFELLANLSEQENYNISDLVSHIVLQIDTKQSLAKICDSQAELVPQITERLATTIIIQSTHLKSYRLHGRYFSMIPTEKLAHLASLILPRMEFANLEHSQNNKLLVNLLRFMCINMDLHANQSQSPTNQRLSNFSSPAENLNRSIVYAQFVSDYLIDLIKRHPIVIKQNRAYLYAVVDNSLQDLRLLTSSELSLNQKTTLYESLLECCNSDLIDGNSRLLSAELMLNSTLLRNRPLVVLELFHAIGQILRDGKILIHMIEALISMYLEMNGHYEKIWKSFCLKVLTSDIYLNVCIEEKASLALLVYFESLSRGSQLEHHHGQQNHQVTGDGTSLSEISSNATRIWSSFFHWLVQLATKFSQNNPIDLSACDAKFVTTLVRMLQMLEPNLGQFLHSDSRHSSAPKAADSVSEKEQTASARGVGGSQHSPVQSEDGETTDGENKKSLQVRAAQAHAAEATSILSSHKCLLELVKQLIALYDSINSGGLWSYLKSSARNEHSIRISITALSVACFMADRTLTCLNSSSSSEIPDHLSLLRGEMVKQRKLCLGKLEAARKLKGFLNCSQFIETLIESVQRNDKVQYSEGVQLIRNYLEEAYTKPVAPGLAESTSGQIVIKEAEFAFMSKILSSSDD